MNRLLTLTLCGLLIHASAASSQGTLKEQKVASPTRLDWEFAARGFGAAAAKLPASFDSAKQRYQLFVPKSYRKDKAAALIVFVSASDQPAGWKTWQTLCEKDGLFFASAHGAGNTDQSGRRVRIILDVLDDVRRRYRIDPDLTYVTGFSGGGRIACSIAFALPEYFGGVIPLCGTNPLAGPGYLRHRIEDRLSVAFVTGEKDSNRKENEVYMAPWFEELGIRTRLWIVPKMGHEIPPASVMSEVHTWLGEDLKRRRDDAKARPRLAVTADETPAGPEQAKRLVEAAQDDLKQSDRIWRGVNLLQGVTQRWTTSTAARDARALLKKIVDDDALLQRVEDQGSKDEVKSLTAQANALERFGDRSRAVEAWELLAKNYAGTPVATKASENIRRLKSKGN